MASRPTASEIDLQLEPNEASDLLPVHEPGLLEAEGWDAAFLTALDEGRVEDSVALLGHRAGARLEEGWSSHRLRFSPRGDLARTEDAEALAIRDGVIYVLGSHYGKKAGPLQPRRQFVARFRQDELAEGVRGARPPLEVARTRFRLHRAVNDALAAAGVDLFPLGAGAREAFIEETRRRGREGGKRWAAYVQPDDLPINVEGAAFRDGGALLLGLRFPTSADGLPLLVEVADVDELFAEDDPPPRCGAVWALHGAGTRAEPTGVRALHHSGADAFQVVVGSLDAKDKGSALLADHPEGAAAPSAHWRFGLDGDGGGAVAAELVHAFGELDRIEGIADGPGGHTLYVVDEESRVDLRFLLAED